MQTMQHVINGCSLHYAIAGPPTAPSILFIHGFPLSGEMWHTAANHLSNRWRCIVPDLRGHGRSQATAEASIGLYADDLASLLDALGETRPAVVVGLSMGGMIAFEMLRRHRGRVRALVLCDTRATPEPPEGLAKREAMAQTALREGSAAVADAMLPNLFAKTTPDSVRRTWRDRMAATPRAGIAAAARALAARPDSRPTLPQVDCPTLVLVGDADVLTPPEQLMEIHRGIRGSRFVTIDGAGHVPPVEQPAAFSLALGEFLDGLS